MERLFVKTYCFDIDGTICTISVADYNLAEPYIDRIKQINDLYDKGNKIIFNTARGFETGIDWSDLTHYQLKEWGVKYHSLHFSKPAADYYIDDKNIDLYNWFNNE